MLPAEEKQNAEILLRMNQWVPAKKCIVFHRVHLQYNNLCPDP